MTIRGVRLRAVLLPLGVATLSIAAVGWYGLVRIPAQERYLNERNLRILRTRGAQLKAKVDNFDRAIDHALESYLAENVRGDQLREWLDEYVRLFSKGDLEIRKAAADRRPAGRSTNVEDVLMDMAGDPPVVKIQRDEGKSYLYLGSKPRETSTKRSVSVVVVRSNLEAIAAAYLDAGSEFDGVLLADGAGRVIAQSAAAVNLARVDTLIDAPRSERKASAETRGPTFASLRMSSNVADVTIGDAGYKLYVQPVQLSLMAVGTDEFTGEPVVNGDPEEWVLCGLVRIDRFRAEGAAISYTYLLWFSTALAAICLGIPLVKLRVLSPRERFSAHDGVWVSVTTFAAAGLLTVIAMDVYVFRYDFRRITDDRLREVAAKLRANLSDELAKIDAQLTELQDGGAKVLRSVRELPKVVVKPHHEVEADVQQHTDCMPSSACESGLLEKTIHGGVTPTKYPYFDLAAWNDVDGAQRVKWSTTKTVTPFLNIKDEKLPHYRELERSWRLAGSESPAPTSGISVFPSPSTGERITVFWRAILAGKDQKFSANAGESMSMSSPIALDRPLLPNHVRFAVVDHEGLVVFHSDGTRSLQENFFKECEDDAALKSAVQNLHDDLLTAYYLGRPTRMYVSRLIGDGAFANPRWSLVVFQDNAVLETLNLETLTLALITFAAFGAVLGAVSALLHFVAPARWTKWFWPDDRKARAYATAALVNAGAIALFVWDAGRLESAALLERVAMLTAGAAIATYLIVTWMPARSRRTVVWHEFVWARATFLFVLAGVPAVASFETAYDFETGLLVKSQRAHEQVDRRARNARIGNRVVDRLALSTKNRIDEFVSKRLHETWDDDLTPLFRSKPRERTDRGREDNDALDALMAWMHRSYNDVADDLKSAANESAPAIDARRVPTRSLAAIVAMLVCAFYALLRRLVQPLFALDASGASSVKAFGASSDLDARVIVVGPPGSGKSTRLARDQRIRIFDVRTLAYLERRKHAHPVPVERRAAGQRAFVRVVGSIGGAAWGEPAAAAPTGPADLSADTWAESFDYSTLPPDEHATVGIDHLDHRLEEPAFRRQTVAFLEELIYRRNRKVRIAADRDPLSCIRDNPLPDPQQASNEIDRWTRVLQSFRNESSGIGDELSPERIETMKIHARDRLGSDSPASRAVLEECRWSPQLMRIAKDVVTWMNPADATSAEDARREFGAAAEPYYRALWQACTVDERLALRQLAEEGLVNPRNQAVVRQLVRSGLVVRDPILRVMNETFRRFILQAATPDEVSAWERATVNVPWASIEAALVTLVVGLAGLLVVTQEQLLGAWIGFVPTLAPAMPTVWKFLASAQRGVKDGHSIAALPV